MKQIQHFNSFDSFSRGLKTIYPYGIRYMLPREIPESVRLSVSVCHKSAFFEAADRNERTVRMEASFDLSLILL